jgi:hypothetical protein
VLDYGRWLEISSKSELTQTIPINQIEIISFQYIAFRAIIIKAADIKLEVSELIH